MTYLSYSDYCRCLFGITVQKVAMDGGFTCPNRDGTHGTTGCTFRNGTPGTTGCTFRDGCVVPKWNGCGRKTPLPPPLP